MTAPCIDEKRQPPAERPSPRGHRWLLFVHQLPSTPSNVRVRTWRRLRQIGALAVKQALYALPDSAGAREDFEWLKTEIEAAGGQASVFAADAVDSWSSDALVEEFRRSRQESYDGLAREVEKQLKRRSRPTAASPPLQQMKKRLAAVERVDFFGSAGRDRVLRLIQQLEERGLPSRRDSAPDAVAPDPTDYNGRHWVTRPRPGIDRLASAWLIRKRIDREARFGFVADRDAALSDSVPFDMFGVEFTHRGVLCTFETLCETFRLHEPALDRIGRIVHDLDLKDARFGAPEAPTIGVLVEGLRLAQADDDILLSEGMALFEALYQAFDHAERLQGPRPVTRRRAQRAQAARSRKRR